MREYIKREAEINKELYSAGVTEAREELEFLAGARDLRDHPDARGAPAGPIWEWASERRDALISYGAFIHPYDMPAQGSTFPNSKIKYARGMPMWTLLSSIDAGREENALRIMNRIRAVSVIHAAIFLEQYGIGVQNGLADIVNEDKFRELLSGDKRRRLQHLCYSLRMFRLKPLASVLHDLIDNSDPRLSDADRIPA
jgi:hypothetical protein